MSRTAASSVFFLLLLTACSTRAKIDNSVKKFYDARNFTGCFSMQDNSSGRVTVYNLSLDTSRFAPYQTFDAVLALQGLQTGAITDAQANLPTSNTSLTKAFGSGDQKYFSEAAEHIGRDSLRLIIDSLSYGNKKIGATADSFWNNSTIKISPDEQLGLMKRLYFDELPFMKSVQQQLRDLMMKEDNTAYRLCYITGSGNNAAGKTEGWVAGWIEENRHVYFFVSYAQAAAADFSAFDKEHLAATKDILKHYGFFEGRK